MPKSNVGSHSFCYAMEFPFKLTSQPLLEDMGQYNSLLKLFPVEIRASLSGHRKARMLVKGWEGTQEMEYSLKTSGSLTQLKREEAIILTGLIHISFQQVQGLQSFETICNSQLIPG